METNTIYYKNYTDKELANYASNLPFQDDIVYELAERLVARVLKEQEEADARKKNVNARK